MAVQKTSYLWPSWRMLTQYNSENMGMKFKDYYAVLGIVPEADDKAVKVAYKKLARQFHPDVSKHTDAEERFKEIGEAYEVLHNQEERARYDALRQQHLNRTRQHTGDSASGPKTAQPHYQSSNDPQTEQEFADFIQSIFGEAQHGFGRDQPHHTHGHDGQPSQKGQDVDIEFPLFLEETLVETLKSIEFTVPQRDPRGRVLALKKSLNVKIPAGVVDGERIRLKGQGAPGIGQGADGDVYLQIRLVPHPVFAVDGHNLSIVVPIAPWEAALGCKINIPTLQGQVKISVAPNSQTGQRLRLKGKGLVSKKVQGDLYAVLKIVNPPSNDAASTKLWEALAEQNTFDPRSNWSN